MSEPTRIWALPPVWGHLMGTYLTVEPEYPAANAREYVRAPSPELMERLRKLHADALRRTEPGWATTAITLRDLLNWIEGEQP